LSAALTTGRQPAERLDIARGVQPPSIHWHKASIHDQPSGHLLGRGMVAAVQQALNVNAAVQASVSWWDRTVCWRPWRG
jgi:hypothetical protein